MSGNAALAFLAGLGKGYMSESMRQSDKTRQDKMDQIKFDEADAAKAERDRLKSMRAQMGDAAAPVTADPNMVAPASMDNRDVGQPGEQPLLQEGYRVGNQTFPDQAAAQAAAMPQNTPDARMARMSDVMMRAGEPVAAQNLRTGAMHEKAGQLALDEATRKAITDKFNEDLGTRVNSFDDLGAFITSSKGDGQNGALQMKPQISADGKTVTMVKLGPDGTETATPYTFSNDAAGLVRAKAMLSKIPVEHQLTHLHSQAQEETARKAQETAAKAQESLSRYHDAMAGAAQMRAGNVGAGRRADHFDEKEWDAAHKIEPALVSFTSPDGGKGVESPELRLAYVSELNAGRARGDMSPSQAAEQARTSVVALRNKASELAAASGGKVSESQAATQLLQAFQQAQRTAGTAGNIPPAATKPDSWIRNAPPGGATRPVASMAASVAQPAPTPTQVTPTVSRADEISAALKADDEIKAGGILGMGGRSVRAGRLPMGIGERRDMERELEKLISGKK